MKNPDLFPQSHLDYWMTEYGPEWFAVADQTPAERFAANEKLLAEYLALGGTMDPYPQSPFYFPDDPPPKGRRLRRVNGKWEEFVDGNWEAV